MNKKDPIENSLHLLIKSDAKITLKEIEKYLRNNYPLSRFILKNQNKQTKLTSTTKK